MVSHGTPGLPGPRSWACLHALSLQGSRVGRCGAVATEGRPHFQPAAVRKGATLRLGWAPSSGTVARSRRAACPRQVEACSARSAARLRRRGVCRSQEGTQAGTAGSCRVGQQSAPRARQKARDWPVWAWQCKLWGVLCAAWVEARVGEDAAANTRAAWWVKARWNRRLWRRLARASEAVAGRPVARYLSLGARSRPEPPGAPRGGAGAAVGAGV